MEWLAEIGVGSGSPKTPDLIFLLCSVGDGNWVWPANECGSVGVRDGVASVGGGARSREREKEDCFRVVQPRKQI